MKWFFGHSKLTGLSNWLIHFLPCICLWEMSVEFSDNSPWVLFWFVVSMIGLHATIPTRSKANILILTRLLSDWISSENVTEFIQILNNWAGSFYILSLSYEVGICWPLTSSFIIVINIKSIKYHFRKIVCKKSKVRLTSPKNIHSLIVCYLDIIFINICNC